MNKHNYKDGRTLKIYYCKEPNCNKEISLNSALYGQGRCGSCSAKQKIGTNAHNYKVGRTLKKYYCKDCGEEVSIISGIYGKSRCIKCANKQHGKDFLEEKNPMFGVHRFGEDAPNWQGGISFEPYPQDFNKKLKNQIRKRDNYKCQAEGCTMTEEEHLIVYGFVLNVHHIDYDKDNCEEKNLITLCHTCNVRANFNRDYWKEYFKEKINVKI